MLLIYLHKKITLYLIKNKNIYKYYIKIYLDNRVNYKYFS